MGILENFPPTNLTVFVFRVLSGCNLFDNGKIIVKHNVQNLDEEEVTAGNRKFHPIVESDQVGIIMRPAMTTFLAR